MAELGDLGYVGLMSFNDPSAGPQAPGPQAPDPRAPGPQAPAGLAPQPMAGTPPLTGVGKRFGASVLDGVIATFTLGIGWLVWTFIILGNGQTPAKQLLHMRVVNVDDGQVVSYGKMWVREFPAKFAIFLAGLFTLGLGWILYFWLCWDDKNQELWDKMCGTVVVEDPNDQLAPA